MLFFAELDENNTVIRIRGNSKLTLDDKKPNEIVVEDSAEVLCMDYNPSTKEFTKGAKHAERFPERVPELRPQTVPTFKLLFTAQERVAIKTSTDPVVEDFYELLSDPRVTSVDPTHTQVQDALFYLESISLLPAGRANEILDACKS